MAIHKILLSGKNWRFRKSGTEGWYHASVPGCVHLDLFNNKIIDDPFFGLNEKKMQWIEKENWEYETSFNIPEELIKLPRCKIIFEGIDTYANIYLNNGLIIKANNMFIPWEKEISSFIKKGKNILRVEFESPYTNGLKFLHSHKYELPANNDEGEKKVSPFTRKAPYMYGWDWGPRLLSSGIWKNVRIEFQSDARIADLNYGISSLSEAEAVVNISCQLEVINKGLYEFEVELDKNKRISKTLDLSADWHQINEKISIRDPEYWWPRGYGEQRLYHVKATLKKNRQIIHNRDVNVGLRTIKLISEKDSDGRSFIFNINGRDVFIRGSNIIPDEYFPSKITSLKYEEMVENAISVNMNMLRAWGGGIYEDDYFYDLCDKHGLLIWQDFMFACGMYPSDESFLQNIKNEIIYQVGRLKNHPSIALWCGNNEVLEGYLNWGWKSQLGNNSEDAYRSYLKVFHELIPEILAEADPSRPYWPSSPYPGSPGPPDLTRGDFHYWDLVKEIKPYTVFAKNVGRFMSEYGFKSYPELRTIESFLETKDWHISSPAMEEHQGWETGAELVEKNMDWFYPSPSNFQQFLYLSQLLQAEAIGFAIENHRKSKPHCSGTLYWQLNDCWPSATWSSIDYFGRWKALHYKLKTVFRDVLLSAEQVDNSLRIHAISDLPEEKEFRLSLKIVDFKGKVIAEHNSMEILSTDESTVIYEQKLEEFITEDEKKKCVLEMYACEGNHDLSRNLYYFVKPRELILEDPEITMHIERKFNKTFLFLKTLKLAKNLYLVNIKTDGFFSENFFDLLPGEEKVVVFEALKNSDNHLEDFRLMSLWNCFN